jgi:ABC-type glycerol-3-phosphate transport system substrate-binding protein
MKGKKRMKKTSIWLTVIFLAVSIVFIGTACKTATTETTTAAETTAAATTAAAETTVAATTTAEKVTINYIHHTQPPFDDIFLKLADEFMKQNPNVEVKIQFYSYADLPTKVKAILATGEGIDCFSISSNEAPWFMANGAVAEVMPSAFGKQTMQEVADLWQKGAFETCSAIYNGKYYGVPHATSIWSGWMNTAYMKEAGLDPAKDIPTTWDQFVDVCKKMTVKKGGAITRNGFATNLKEPMFPFWMITTMMEQKGLDWSTDQGILASLDKPEAVEAFKTFTDFAGVDGIWDPGLFTDDRQGFGDGNTATFLSAGAWYWGVEKGMSVKTEDILPYVYPRFADGKDIGGSSYGVTDLVAAQSKNQEIAWKLISYIESKPEEFIAQAEYCPRTSLDPALVEKNIPNSDVFINEIPKGTVLLASPNYSQIQDAVATAASSVISQGMSVEDAIAQLKTEVGQIVSK